MRITPLRRALLALALFGIGACGRSPQVSKPESFKPAAVASSENLPFQLSRTQVPHSLSRKTISGGRYAFDLYQHELLFEPMNAAEFALLKQTYGSWSQAKSSVSYTAGRRYQLQDFLPPLVQALFNRKYQEDIATIAGPNGSSLQASTVANCWGTVYEVMREAQRPQAEVSIFYAHDDAMQSFIRNNNYSSLVKPFSKSKADFATAAARNENMQPGDILVVGDEYLYHMAIFVDDDLFFEKSGSGDSTMFRLVTADLLLQTWSPDLFGWSVRRFDRAQLPDPLDLFGAQHLYPNDAFLQSFPENTSKDMTVIREERPAGPRYTYFKRTKFRYNGRGELQP